MVQDNGIGVELGFKEKILGIFKRFHSSSQYLGTGLGLALCQRILERAGSRVGVESGVGIGSTFCFAIPRGKATRERSEQGMRLP